MGKRYCPKCNPRPFYESIPYKFPCQKCGYTQDNFNKDAMIGRVWLSQNEMDKLWPKDLQGEKD